MYAPPVDWTRPVYTPYLPRRTNVIRNALGVATIAGANYAAKGLLAAGSRFKDYAVNKVKSYYKRIMSPSVPRPMTTQITPWHGSTSGAHGERKEVSSVVLAAGAMTTYASGNNSNLVFLNTIDVGSSSTTHVGKKYTVTGLNIRGTIIHEDSVTAYPHEGRVMVVYDSAPTGATPVLSLILNTTSTTSPVNNYRNSDNTWRFRVLDDQRISLGPLTTDKTTDKTYAIAMNASAPVNVNWKGALPVHTVSTGGGVADIRIGALYLVAYSTTAAVLRSDDLVMKLHFHDD